MYVVHLKFTEKTIQRWFLFDTDSVGQWQNSEKDVCEPFWAIEFIVLFCQDKFKRPFSRPFIKFFDILFLNEFWIIWRILYIIIVSRKSAKNNLIISYIVHIFKNNIFAGSSRNEILLQVFDLFLTYIFI